MQNHILKTCKITVKTQKMTCMLQRGGGRIYYNSMASWNSPACSSAVNIWSTMKLKNTTKKTQVC